MLARDRDLVPLVGQLLDAGAAYWLDGDVYFSVVRYRTLYHTVAHVKGGAPKIAFTVTADMLPNAAVEAVLVR